MTKFKKQAKWCCIERNLISPFFLVLNYFQLRLFYLWVWSK